MKSILYIGNKLQNKRSNVSTIHTLGTLLESENYTVYYASSKANKVLRLLDMVFTFFKYKTKVDYVLIDTYSTQNFYFALVISQLCRLFNVKYIPNLNGGDLPMRLEKNPILCSWIFKNAYIKISPSQYLIDAFKNFGYKNVIYIPNTIVINNYEFRERDFTSIKLLWVRSFSEIYNSKLAIRVLKKLKEDNIDASLCMVGPDSDGSLSKVKKFAKKQKVTVNFTGKLSKKKWTNLSKDYNIFINTTNFDNAPVSVIEAMALGLPIVSTNVGGIPFLIANKKEGILVEQNNTEAMVNAIKSIYNNNELAKLLTINARRKVEQFDWQEVKKLWFEILK
ncbi:MAG: glycosyltransferase family 4 protein [Bacteroidetes bacterium]|nr:glycosyltransferase family 4 protein [Bacteroidota bacterium]